MDTIGRFGHAADKATADVPLDTANEGCSGGLKPAEQGIVRVQGRWRSMRYDRMVEASGQDDQPRLAAAAAPRDDDHHRIQVDANRLRPRLLAAYVVVPLPFRDRE
jgi:hypothetical protein